MTTCKYERKCMAYYEEDDRCISKYEDCALYKFREHLVEQGLVHIIELTEKMLPEEIE
jgi:hypothetical protein